MNIWILDETPSETARFYCDRHVAAGINELTHMLSTAHVLLDSLEVATQRVPLAKWPTHVNHPCAVWVRESVGNYSWAADLAWHLCRQFTLRFQRGHEYERIINSLKVHSPLALPVLNGSVSGRTPFCQSMPVEYKKQNAVQAYREYYFATKQGELAKWSVVGVPKWWKDMVGKEVAA